MASELVRKARARRVQALAQLQAGRRALPRPARQRLPGNDSGVTTLFDTAEFQDF